MKRLRNLPRPKTPTGWLQFGVMIAALLGGGSGAYEGVFHAPMKEQDQAVANKAQWEAIRTLRVEVADLKTDIAVLKDRETRAH